MFIEDMIKKIKQECNLKNLVCLCIGKNKIQFDICLKLKDKLNPIKAYYFEDIMHLTEDKVKILNEKGFFISKLLKNYIRSDEPTLFYVPKCVKIVYFYILFANTNDTLKNVYIYGNDLLWLLSNYIRSKIDSNLIDMFNHIKSNQSYIPRNNIDTYDDKNENEEFYYFKYLPPFYGYFINENYILVSQLGTIERFISDGSPNEINLTRDEIKILVEYLKEFGLINSTFVCFNSSINFKNYLDICTRLEQYFFKKIMIVDTFLNNGIPDACLHRLKNFKIIRSDLVNIHLISDEKVFYLIPEFENFYYTTILCCNETNLKNIFILGHDISIISQSEEMWDKYIPCFKNLKLIVNNIQSISIGNKVFSYFDKNIKNFNLCPLNKFTYNCTKISNIHKIF